MEASVCNDRTVDIYVELCADPATVGCPQASPCLALSSRPTHSAITQPVRCAIKNYLYIALVFSNTTR